MPAQPISAMPCHSSGDHSSPRSRRSRCALTGELSSINDFADSRSICCSSFSIRAIVCSPFVSPRLARQAQNSLCDDVQLNLGGASLDRVSLAAQPVLGNGHVCLVAPIQGGAAPE